MASRGAEMPLWMPLTDEEASWCIGNHAMVSVERIRKRNIFKNSEKKLRFEGHFLKIEQ
jgi:hypothetical protein